MLRSDIEKRVDPGMEDDEGPWKLVAYLSDIQPSIDYENVFYPNLTFRILADDIAETNSGFPIKTEIAKKALLELSEESINAELEHLLSSAQTSLDKIEEALDIQKLDRFDSLETFIAGLEERSEVGDINSQKLNQELSNLVRTPLRLSASQIDELMKVLMKLRKKFEGKLKNFWFL